jgi:DNA polymerase-1
MLNKRLVLIDGHAILHRAYHALPPTFRNKGGTSTNAVYGFTTMLLKVLKELKPTHLAVAFDRPEPTFRSQLYTPYQAKRPEMESNLAEQIPLLHELLQALRIPHFELGGYEADDLLGSIAAQSQKLDTIIVTGDRDMLQLINSRIKVCVPVKGLSETKIYDPKSVKEEFGVHPNQWVDVKALKGDPSDNYPGVSGIGPKTAQELVAKYGTLEGIYRNLSQLDGKTAKKLAEGVEDAGLAKKLATIVTDVPVDLDLEKARTAGINWNLGIKYMREKLGFRAISERIEKEYLGKGQMKLV